MSEPMKAVQTVNLPPAPNEFIDKGIWGGRGDKPVETSDPGVKLLPPSEAAKRKGLVAGANPVQSASPGQKDKPVPLAQTNVRLKFEVDSKTREIKVLILDPASHKVIRTIPADELKNFRDGDMVELFT
ncbi:MAG TPA: flagellar protein FlaG [Anaerolineaceae bacterium]|nr:flagellar protein FlaG [Anaerolineaceae bacterium]